MVATSEPGAPIYTYLLPIRRGIWLPGPGWLEMPIRLGPGIQAHLRDLQPDPISTERLLQNRGAEEEEEKRPKPPQDETLEDAVACMTAAAEEAGKERLVLSPEGWAVLVQQYMANPDLMAFSHEIIERVGAVEKIEDLDHWLAHNIWNNTPQPDRGGKSPNELAREQAGSR